MNNKKRVAVYTQTKYKNMDGQLSENMQWAYYKDLFKNNPLAELVGIYEEFRGEPNGKKPALQSLIEDCKKGEIQEVCVKSLSRLGRGVDELLKIIHEFEVLGVTVFCEIEKTVIRNSLDIFKLMPLYGDVWETEIKHKNEPINVLVSRLELQKIRKYKTCFTCKWAEKVIKKPIHKTIITCVKNQLLGTASALKICELWEAENFPTEDKP
ncbi:hypothetical protein FACS1894211_06760 [Clostridia bacterium]|nr:hypothetical protein FACS1894211_06760 [Clostridia bacterium]